MTDSIAIFDRANLTVIGHCHNKLHCAGCKGADASPSTEEIFSTKSHVAQLRALVKCMSTYIIDGLFADLNPNANLHGIILIIWLLRNLVEASFDLFRYLLPGDQLIPWERHPLVSFTCCIK